MIKALGLDARPWMCQGPTKTHRFFKTLFFRVTVSEVRDFVQGLPLLSSFALELQLVVAFVSFFCCICFVGF